MNIRLHQQNTINTIHCKLMTTTDNEVDTFKALILTVSKCKLCIWFTLLSVQEIKKLFFFGGQKVVYTVFGCQNDLK